MSGIPAGAGALLGKRLGKYEILALLALGGTAEIYLARIGGAAGFEKYVVVKCLHDHLADDTEFVKMFLDEARLAAHLDHSNIVQTMELGEHEGRYYMVMEFLAGLSLAMIVRRASERLPGGRIPIPMVLNMLAQASAGLHYAHEKAANGKPLNIVHRDISPQNLVISFEGVVKVVDFGIAKAEMRETKTKSGTIKGKFAYMSPEQCIANNVDRRTDVFALGVIAHELLTGRRLFKKPSPYETYQAVIECAVEPPSKSNVEVDPALDPIIMKAVSKEKEDRYPTAEAFGDALLGYLHHRGKGSGPGDVSRFFEAHFGQEIEEHGARMRELISGRESQPSDSGWEEEEDRRRNETVDLGGKMSGGDRASSGTDSLDSMDLVEEGNVLEGVSGEIGDDADADEIPADRTRIQENPLEQIDQLNEVVAKQKTPPPELMKSRPTSALRKKTPLPALVPTQLAPQDSPRPPQLPNRPPPPPSGALPLPAPPTGPLPATVDPPRPSSGKFPDHANLPTMIVDEDESSSPELAPTRAAPPIDQARVDPLGRTNLAMDVPSVNGVRVSAPVPAGARPHSVPPLPQAGPPQSPQPPGGAPHAQGSPRPNPSGPIPGSTGPNPSGPNPSGPNPSGPIPSPGGPPPSTPQGGVPRGGPSGPIGPSGYPVLSRELRAEMAAGASVFPSPPKGRASIPDSGPFDPARAADLASPVGGAYGDVDWDAEARRPAHALPPWKLALLFVGALGVALLITIVIAKIAS